MPETIHFYGTAEEFGAFSNFAQYPITIDGERWRTSEHYFQAQKFTDIADRQAVQNAKKAMLAAQIGRDRKRSLRRDWESVKDDIMRKAVLAKFQHHDELRELLLSTGDAELVEHTANDAYWGDGGDGSGKNMLGRILMEVREILRKEAADRS